MAKKWSNEVNCPRCGTLLNPEWASPYCDNCGWDWAEEQKERTDTHTEARADFDRVEKIRHRYLAQQSADFKPPYRPVEPGAEDYVIRQILAIQEELEAEELTLTLEKLRQAVMRLNGERPIYYVESKEIPKVAAGKDGREEEIFCWVYHDGIMRQWILLLHPDNLEELRRRYPLKSYRLQKWDPDPADVARAMMAKRPFFEL